MIPVFGAQLVEALLKLGIAALDCLIQVDPVSEEVVKTPGRERANKLNRSTRKVSLTVWGGSWDQNVRAGWKLIHLVTSLIVSVPSRT